MSRQQYMDAPAGVTVYDNPIMFLVDRRGRRETAWDIGDLTGWDVADGFCLAEPQLPGAPESEWRISVTETEIYAVLRRLPLDRLYTFDGPVWFIASIPDRLRSQTEGDLVPTAPVMALMREVELLRRQPGSLLAAVDAIHRKLPHLTFF